MASGTGRRRAPRLKLASSEALGGTEDAPEEEKERSGGTASHIGRAPSSHVTSPSGPGSAPAVTTASRCSIDLFLLRSQDFQIMLCYLTASRLLPLPPPPHFLEAFLATPTELCLP